MSDLQSLNPALTEWTGPDGLPQFESVRDADFAPAFEAALAEHEAEIEAIAADPEPPTFENTVEALEIAGDRLSRVSALFWNRAGAHTNDVIQALERDIAPKMSDTIRRSERIRCFSRGSTPCGRPVKHWG